MTAGALATSLLDASRWPIEKRIMQTHACCLSACRTTPFAAKNYLSTYKKIAAYSKHCKLKWKPDMTEEARELIQGMLHPKPAQRLGNTSGGIDELKGHRWFESLDWDKLYKKEVHYSHWFSFQSGAVASISTHEVRQRATNALAAGLLPQLPAPFTPEVKDSTDLTYFNPEGEHVRND